MGPTRPNPNATNTLPARVTPNGPSGRHFKPFDHRRMNPMAEIQEDPSGAPGEPIYQRPPSQAGPQGHLIVQKSPHLPHMPPEVRHTNYHSTNGTPATAKKLANPHILEHRDSANFSMASSDSG